MDYTFGKLISADGDFVRYSSKFTVTKGMLDEEEYKNQITFQTLLSKKGLAPSIIQKDVKHNNHTLIVSSDAGLPLEQKDIPLANKYLDTLYDMGIDLHWCLHISHFVKGFDGKIRATDFRQTKLYTEAIKKDKRVYI